MKTNSLKRSILLIIALLLATLACSLVNPQAAETQAPEGDNPATSSQTTQPESEDSGLCSNPLYPVKVGTTWTYQSTGSVEGDYGFTDTITDVREDGFTLTSQFSELTRTQEWACNPEGLTSLTVGGGAAAGISTTQG